MRLSKTDIGDVTGPSPIKATKNTSCASFSQEGFHFVSTFCGSVQDISN